MSVFIPLPVKVPQPIKWLYSGYTWDKFNEVKEEKILYLTFDDGPIPEVTPWVLETLVKFNAKATFFCIGDNVSKHLEIYRLLLESDNTVGNHTFNHLKGWRTPTNEYVKNVLKAQNEIEKGLASTEKKQKKFLRPPYGKIKNGQAKKLKKLGFEIIMYDTIAYDWDASIAGEKCADNIIKHAKSGSIIVFHDSLKAEKNLKLALPEVLEYYTNKGYKFEAL